MCILIAKRLSVPVASLLWVVTVRHDDVSVVCARYCNMNKMLPLLLQSDQFVFILLYYILIPPSPHEAVMTFSSAFNVFCRKSSLVFIGCHYVHVVNDIGIDSSLGDTKA
jgi:hypothetical protein